MQEGKNINPALYQMNISSMASKPHFVSMGLPQNIGRVSLLGIIRYVNAQHKWKSLNIVNKNK